MSTSASDPVASVRALTVRTADGASLLRSVDLSVPAGSCTVVVGRSGAGKSTLAAALLGAFPEGAHVQGGVVVGGVELVGCAAAALERVRRDVVGFLPQDVAASLSPVRRIGAHVVDLLAADGGRGARRRAKEAVGERLTASCLAGDAVARARPFEVSGGMLQRSGLAIAVARRPRLLVLDEPTSALDRASAPTVLAAVRAVRERGGAAVVLTHDAWLADEIATDVVELDAGALRRRTAGNARPSLAPSGPLVKRVPGAPVVRAEDLRKRFTGAPEVLGGIDVVVGSGDVIGVTGRSGSGKSTLCRVLLGVLRPDHGRVLVAGTDLARARGAALRAARRRVQPVVQDTSSSLDPRWTIGRSVSEPLLVAGLGVEEADERARAQLEQVGLPRSIADRLPGAASGGERQRAAIARALVTSPLALVLDEPTSALDAATRDLVADVLGAACATGVGLVVATHDDVLLDRLRPSTVLALGSSSGGAIG